MLGLAKDEIADEDEDFSFEERELQRIANSVESPLSAYARYLARLDTVNPFYANMLRVRYPVTKLVKADIMYARKTWKNRLFMLNGSPGCVSLNTVIPILTENGLEKQKIGDLIGESVRVFGYDFETDDFHFLNAEVVDAGLKRMHRIVLSNGYSVEASSEHKFYKEKEDGVKEVTADKVKVGDWLLMGNRRKLYQSTVMTHINRESDIYDEQTYFASVARVESVGIKMAADVVMPKGHIYMLGCGLITHNTFKSFSAITMCDWLDQNGFWTHNKGNYDLPKLFFNTIDLMGYLQSDAKLGDCLIGGTIITMADGSKRTISELMKMSKLGIRNFAFKTYNIIRKVPELGIGWVRTAGRKRTMKVTFDDGTELVGTSNHKVLLKNYKYVTLQKLKFDDEVIEV